MLSRARIILRLLTVFFCVVRAVAANSDTVPPTPTAIAARVDHHYNALHSLRVNFVQQYDGMGMHRRESGTLLLAKPGRMRWTYAEPAGKLFILDGHNAYFYAPGQTEVQRVPAKKLDDMRSPLRFLLGHTEIARELSNLTVSPLVPNQTANSGAAPPQVFELSGTPKGMEQRVASFRLTVSASGAILGIRIEETDGAITDFTLTGEEQNVPTTSGDFVFKAPPGTSIVTGLPPI
ncbi:MAG TPA: outer membrane lipoprotein carrier protein LolA [Acidisarcina sp.]